MTKGKVSRKEFLDNLITYKYWQRCWLAARRQLIAPVISHVGVIELCGNLWLARRIWSTGNVACGTPVVHNIQVHIGLAGYHNVSSIKNGTTLAHNALCAWPAYLLLHTLTGHSGKVMAAKFLGEPSKVVTGSHDRTLKIWDLRSRACIETKFAGSSCNDLVTSDGAGSTIISGHFDKRIRFWDARSESCANDIVLQGKVTSLDLTRDCNYLCACVRDDTLKLLDLRMNQIVLSFSSDGFKVGCDWARATFSPDGQFIAVGSADGSVYVWGVATAKVEAILKQHTSAVTATSWHPYGAYLVSVDKAKNAIVWTDV
ncbi:Autophagy-related 16 [Carabus blaptoides fortunei]